MRYKTDSYVVYELCPKYPFFKEVDTVKATSSESARRKAIIGTNKRYADTIATTASPNK